MIKSIFLKGVATYPTEGIEVGDLKKFNFFYGANGSGKTTISQLLATPDSFSECRVAWESSEKLEVNVYNKNFVEANFKEVTKGIFTMGEQSVQLMNEINALVEERQKVTAHLQRLRISLFGEDGSGGATKSLAEQITRANDRLWSIKDSLPESLRESISGFRGSKEAFREKLLTEFESNLGPYFGIEELEQHGLGLFSNFRGELPYFKKVTFDRILDFHLNPIFETSFDGENTNSVASLISRLGNIDWVNKGLSYVDDDSLDCPFCQQGMHSSIVSSLRAFFSGDYGAALSELASLSPAFDTEVGRLQSDLESLISSVPDFFDSSELIKLRDALFTLLEKNKSEITKKIDAPSTSITLTPIANLVAQIEQKQANLEMQFELHNSKIRNLNSERARVSSLVWGHLIDNNRDDIELFKRELEIKQKTVEELQKKVRETESLLAELACKLHDLELRQTDVSGSVSRINFQLMAFGFTGFKLTTAGEDSIFYEIIRDDGSRVEDSLSEGERNFLSFLYFLELVNGSHQEVGVSNRRVVVIDDPVSSLDSNVMFVITHLIRELIECANLPSGLVDQVFLFTHNIYFHNQVTYGYSGTGIQTPKSKSFWIIRKRSGISNLERFETNPVKSAYELLWSELSRANLNKTTLGNTLRRILEHYFQSHSTKAKEDLFEMFSSEEKGICVSLLSWANADSHDLMDDVFAPMSDELVDVYLKVFKKIFEVNGQLGHYEMMMNRII